MTANCIVDNSSTTYDNVIVENLRKQLPEQESCEPLQFPFAKHVRLLDPCNAVKPMLQLTRQVVL